MVIETVQLQAGYKKNKNTILKTGPKASLNADAGDLIAFMGHNGVGKSTFLRTLASLQEAIEGTILLFGKNLVSYSRKELAQKIAYVSTENTGQNFMSVWDTIALGRFPYTNWLGNLEPSDVSIVEKSLELVNLSSLQNKPINEISDGERQRVMIARAIAQDTPIILLDEPTAFLDLQNKYQIAHLLSDLAHKQKKTILFTTHDLNIALDEADKIWFMNNENALEAAPEEFINHISFCEFIGSHLSFDNLNYSIRRIPEKLTEVHLHATEENLFHNTLKALERIGCTLNEKADYKISVEKKTSEIHYKITINAMEHEFSSIYELCKFIRSITI